MRGEDRTSGVVLLRRRRGAHPGEPSAASDAAADQCGAGRVRREVFGALRGNWASLDPAGALAAGLASAASLFDPLGAAAGRTAGVSTCCFAGSSGLRSTRACSTASERRAFFGRWHDVESLASMKSLRPGSAWGEGRGNGPGSPAPPGRSREADFRNTQALEQNPRLDDRQGCAPVRKGRRPGEPSLLSRPCADGGP